MNKINQLSNKYLYAAVAIIVGLYFLIKGLSIAESFLAPFFIAGTLSLIIYPLAKKLENLGLARTFASLLSVLLLFIISIGILGAVFFQIQNFTKEWPSIEKTMAPKIENLKGFIVKETPVTNQSIEDLQGKKKDEDKLVSNPKSKVWSLLTNVGSFLIDYLLTFIYVFFILRYRKRFLNFIIRILPNKHQKEIENTASEIIEVVSSYLVGKLILMGSLTVAYSIGLGISGVNNFILISIVATLLTLVPYLGNVVGFSLALAFGYLVSGDLSVLIGIVITFSVSQFLETYVLQPFVMGQKVNLHPFLVIIMVILGGAIWGVTGMILAVPITAIITTVLKHISSLRLLGLFFQNESLKKSPS